MAHAVVVSVMAESDEVLLIAHQNLQVWGLVLSSGRPALVELDFHVTNTIPVQWEDLLGGGA